MSMLRTFVLAAVACAVAAAPAAAAQKAKKKHHHHHTYHGVIEKVEHKEHKIVIKLHHHTKKQAAAAGQATKRGSKKKHAHTEVTVHVGHETKIHVHDGKHKHNGSFSSLKDGEHVVVHATGHEAKDIEVHLHKKTSGAK
jgi:hypothetical protein